MDIGDKAPEILGTIRTTFIISEEGIIEQIFAGKQVKTKEHAEQILKSEE